MVLLILLFANLFSNRWAKSTIICQSWRASAGGLMAGLTRVMRRSELVTVPSFSPQVLAGSNTSAYSAVSILLYASCTTTNSALPKASSTLFKSGSECAGLVQAIQIALIDPSLTALNISTAVLPGVAGTSATSHSLATSARCSALAISRCADSKLAMPPASRPPMALG